MKLLTRAEELILLAVWQLKEDAYCVPIRKKLCKITGDKWSLGSIYMPLDRMVKNGLLTSTISEATPERGGRPKRVYALTHDGKAALIKVRDVQAAMWNEAGNLGIEAE